MSIAGSVLKLADHMHLFTMRSNYSHQAMKRMHRTILDSSARQWLTTLLGSAVRFDEPMSRHTSFRIGGPADALAEPESLHQLRHLLRGAAERRIPVQLIGGGTNLLVADAGIRGLVVRLNRMTAVAKWTINADRVQVTAGLGLTTKSVCALALRRGWRGFNFALGIPGSLGGAVMMNAGTGLGCMADVLESLTLLTQQEQLIRLDKSALQWEYRRCTLPSQAGSDPILIEAEFTLTAGARDTLRQEAQTLMRQRSRRQPLGMPSAGSFFKNPTPERPAGQLIDQVGLKGLTVGKARVSPVHANFIVNLGGATARDVLRLQDIIQSTIRDRWSIELVPEVRFVGQSNTP